MSSLRKRTRLAAVFAVALFASAAAGAAERPDEVKVSSLTLTAAVREALERSPELVKLRLAAREAELEEPLLLAETDPVAQALYRWEDDRAPRQVPVFQGERARRENMNVGIVQKTILGTEASLIWRNERLRSPAPFRPLDPTVESRLSFDVRQPLLRYFWGRPDKARRRFFRSGARAARARVLQREADIAGEVARAYLELRRAERDLRIAEDSVEAARKLSNLYTDKKRYGLVDESDRLQALASLEIQETERVLARSRRDQARTVLRAALLRQSVEPDADFSLADPPPFPAVAESLEEALRMGLDRRPDIAAARARVESAEWAFRITKLDTLPELHAEGSYGVAGLDRTYSEAWDDLGTWDHPVKSAGVSLSVPFGFRKERLERTSARLRLEEAKSEHEQAVQRVLTEIRTAWEFWQTAQTRLGAAGTLVDLERKKLKAESEDFERGRSSTDLLVRFQQDLHRARRQLVQAEVDEYLARADLARATGLLADVLAKISGGEETE